MMLLWVCKNCNALRGEGVYILNKVKATIKNSKVSLTTIQTLVTVRAVAGPGIAYIHSLVLKKKSCFSVSPLICELSKLDLTWYV